MREFILFVLAGIVLPSIINKTTERGRLEFVHEYIQEIWTFVLAVCTYFWLLDTGSVRGLAVSFHQRYSNHPYAPYLVVGALGFSLFCFFWWATGRVLHTEAATPTSTPAQQVPQDKREPQRSIIQKSKGNNSPNVHQEQNNSGGTNIQQNSTGPNSPNLATTGPNSPITLNQAKPDREWVPTKEQLAFLREHPFRVHVFTVSDAESTRFAAKIADVLANCGWEIVEVGTSSYAGPLPNGVWMMTKSKDDAAYASFSLAIKPIPVGRKIAPEMTVEWGSVIVVGVDAPLGTSLPIATMVNTGPYRH